MIWPPYEWPTTIVGPSCRDKTCRSRSTSAANEVIGNWGAVTLWPSAWSRSMTPLQQEPSAHAPWTRTMFGCALIADTPLWEVGGSAARVAAGRVRAATVDLSRRVTHRAV